jgi:SAM-dependent methyltransferase
MQTRTVTISALIVVAAGIGTVPAQERFSFFLASTPQSVERMLTLAELRDDDVVLDLGSGDGLIPLTAARMNPRLRGRGVDIDPDLVEQSNARARREGLGDRVRFDHQNAFDADFSEATVVTMWFFPELMQLLRPVILERARPGTRVLASTWTLGNWKADAENKDDAPPVFMWVVPARVGGGWDWDLEIEGRRFRHSAVLDQQFQVVEGVARVGARRETLTNITLRGEDIAFSLAITVEGLGLTRHDFSGKVKGAAIEGTVSVTPADRTPVSLPWRARKSDGSGYFAPTGTALFQAPVRAK